MKDKVDVRLEMHQTTVAVGSNRLMSLFELVRVNAERFELLLEDAKATKTPTMVHTILQLHHSKSGTDMEDLAEMKEELAALKSYLEG